MLENICHSIVSPFEAGTKKETRIIVMSRVQKLIEIFLNFQPNNLSRQNPSITYKLFIFVTGNKCKPSKTLQELFVSIKG